MAYRVQFKKKALRLAEEMQKRDFILEVLSLYIPELVEAPGKIRLSIVVCAFLKELKI